jgi:hypothetical protein
MSTIPGESTWADAGLVPTEVGAPEAEELAPAQARPDLRDEAAEPDVVEQALPAADADDEDDYPES